MDGDLMSWFFFALICVLGWGLADLFYKKSADDADGTSHLKTAVWVGITMGAVSVILLPFSESGLSSGGLLRNAFAYLPASLSYIISMVIGYAGLRYLELSIVSPVQNASGAFSLIVMLMYFAFSGNTAAFSDTFGTLDIIGTVMIVAGTVGLAAAEQKLSKAETEKTEKKYRTGAMALIFPLLYCLFDTIGTAADGVILSEEAGLGLGEIDVLVLYGLTFFAAGIVCWLYMRLKSGKPYNPFKKSEMPKCAASVCEQFGQIFYVFAMAREPMLAAPMVASYCIISVILSRIFLREKLQRSLAVCVLFVIFGIVLLGISEGLAEA